MINHSFAYFQCRPVVVDLFLMKDLVIAITAQMFRPAMLIQPTLYVQLQHLAFHAHPRSLRKPLALAWDLPAVSHLAVPVLPVKLLKVYQIYSLFGF